MKLQKRLLVACAGGILSLALCACGGGSAPTAGKSGGGIEVAPLVTQKPGGGSALSAQNVPDSAVPGANAASTNVPGLTLPAQTASAAPAAGTSTPAQTADPSATSTPYGVVGESPAVDGSYFDDAVFVGDSVSLKLNYYNVASGALGKAQFLTSGSLGSANALWDVSSESVHPSFQGQKMRVEDAVAQCGAKKLYIMLGMNDVGLYGPEDSLKNFTELMGLIQEKTPGLTVYVESVTPMTATSTLKALTNEKIVQYNALVKDACADHGWYFLDLHAAFVDADGTLPRTYCSDPDDMGVHFTDAGCAQWADYLKTHTVTP